MRSSPSAVRIGGYRQRDGEHRARAVGAVAGGDGAAHRLDEAAADRKAQPGARALRSAPLHAVELVEDALEVAGRNAGAFVEHLQQDLPLSRRA